MVMVENDAINLAPNHTRYSGNFTRGVTPVPIPNTAVKPVKVDGTMVSRPWESRTLPVLFKALELFPGLFHV